MGDQSDTMRKYLTALKESTGLSWAELAAATKLPDSTIRKIFSGETADPRLETISLIVSAMGGSLDAMLSGRPEMRDAEINALNLLRESYESRIQDIKSSTKAFTDSLKKDKTMLFIIACTQTVLLVLFLVISMTVGSAG